MDVVFSVEPHSLRQYTLQQRVAGNGLVVSGPTDTAEFVAWIFIPPTR